MNTVILEAELDTGFNQVEIKSKLLAGFLTELVEACVEGCGNVDALEQELREFVLSTSILEDERCANVRVSLSDGTSYTMLVVKKPVPKARVQIWRDHVIEGEYNLPSNATNVFGELYDYMRMQGSMASLSEQIEASDALFALVAKTLGLEGVCAKGYSMYIYDTGAYTPSVKLGYNQLILDYKAY